jgi:hypothetical protein
LRDRIIAKIAAFDRDAEQAIAECQAGLKRAEEALAVSDYKKLKRAAGALVEQIEELDLQMDSRHIFCRSFCSA